MSQSAEEVCEVVITAGTAEWLAGFHEAARRAAVGGLWPEHRGHSIHLPVGRRYRGRGGR